MTNPAPENPKDEKKKLGETLESLRKNEKIEGIYNYASSNTRDTVAYILMIVGIVLLFTNTFYGGLLVGLIFGYYFSQELLKYSRSINDLIEEQGMVRSLIFGGLLLALFISAPAIFIGTGLAIVLKQILSPEAK